MNKLGEDTVRLLSSSQVITSSTAVVKELVENSLDAGATNVEIKLENYCLDKIEVRDNGRGMKRDEVAQAAQPYFTSKLTSFADLSQLHSYGFRGEGLSSVAAVADVSITTCTEQDEVAMTCTVDHGGNVVSSRPSAAAIGTTVSVANLFKNVPVRKRYCKTTKVAKESFKKTESLLLALGLANSSVRFVLKHDKCLIWQKPSTADFRSNVGMVLGTQMLQQLVPVSLTSNNPSVNITGFVPSANADPSITFKATPERVFLLVNSRPVTIKPVLQLLRKICRDVFPGQSGRYPVAIVRIDVPPSELDINLESDKSRVALHNLDAILDLLKSAIDTVYRPSTKDCPIDDDQPLLSPSQSSTHSQSSFLVESEKESLCDEEKGGDTDPPSNGRSAPQHQTPSSATNTGSPPPSQPNSPTCASNIIDSDELAAVLDDDFTSSSDEDTENTSSVVMSNKDCALPTTKQVSLTAWSRGLVPSHHNKPLEPVTLPSRPAASSMSSINMGCSSCPSIVQTQLDFGNHLSGAPRTEKRSTTLPSIINAKKRRNNMGAVHQKTTMHSFTAVMEKNSKSQRQIQNEDLDFDKLCGRCSAINARVVDTTGCSNASCCVIGLCRLEAEKELWLAHNDNRILLLRPDELRQQAGSGSVVQTRGAVCALLHRMIEQELSDRVLYEVAVLTDT